MPAEWNKVISAMREYEGTQSYQTQDHYRNATEEEISEPEDFRHPGTTDNICMDQMKAQTITRLEPRKEDWDFKRLRAKYKRPQSIATKLNAPEGPIKPSGSKGKQKELTNIPRVDEYSHLRDHWCEDYTDILDGTRDTLPPWREVNHEIHLIDPSKHYHYHLP
jgi:hypothetical protein